MKIRTFINNNQQAGKHSVVWDGTDNSGNTVSPGVCFYKLKINNEPVSTRKMVVK